MKKIFISLFGAIISLGIAEACDSNNLLIELTKKVVSTDFLFNDNQKNYSSQKEAVLSEEALSNENLIVKYKCVQDINERLKDLDGDQWSEAHDAANAILLSFPATKSTEPACIFAIMKTVRAFIVYNFDSRYVDKHWAEYAYAQAGNKILARELRKKFAKLYGQCSDAEDKEALTYKLLYEISSEVHEK